MMTYKEILINAMRGLPADELPICPRLDLWYYANKYRGTLPDRYRHATLFQIIEDLEIGYNTTIPNFRALEDPKEEAHRALGLFQCADIFYTVAFDLEVQVRIDGDELVTQYITPYGTITTKSLYSEKMREDGVTVSHISEKAFKSPEDYKALQYIFDHVSVTPRYDRVGRMEETAGDRGVPFGWILSTASPMHYIQKQLMGFEQFFFELFDRPGAITELARSIKMMEDKIVDVMLDAPVEVYRMGGNYDSMMQNPPFFAEHIAPYLKERASQIHERGKIFTTHTDGENDGLLELYLASNIDVAESLCPAPMMKLSVKETRYVFGDEICIWGGIPSLMMLPGSYSEKAYDAFLDEFYQAIGDGRKLIISVADTIPPEADFNRIKKLIWTAKKFGPVPKE